MTPAETITRKLKARIEASGATVPVVSLLLEALEGAKHEAPSSGIGLNVHLEKQLAEAIPLYQFTATAILTVSIDDDKGGRIFKANHDAVWAAFDFLARADNCAELGGEDFSADGFEMDEGEPPQFSEDTGGGSWTTTFSATVTGRAN